MLISTIMQEYFCRWTGAEEHLDNNTSYKILQEAFLLHIPIGAICIATRILAKAGVLRDKYATGWNEDGLLDALFKEYGVVYLPEEKVVVDSNTITATDPSAAEEFGKRIIELLQANKAGDNLYQKKGKDDQILCYIFWTHP